MNAALLDPKQRKRRISFWMWLLFVVSVVCFFVSTTHSLFSVWTLSGGYGSHRQTPEIMLVADVLFLFLYSIPLAANLFCYFYFLFRMWEEVPPQFARTTPGMAAGLSLIPVFSLYWMFVALGGLYDDMNKVMQSYGREKRFNSELLIIACVIWLVVFFFCMMLGFVQGVFMGTHFFFAVAVLEFVNIFVLLSETVFTCVIFWIMRKNVLQFVDIKTECEKAAS